MTENKSNKSTKFTATVFWQKDGSIRLTTNPYDNGDGQKNTGTVIIVKCDGKNGTHAKLHKHLADRLLAEGKAPPSLE